MGHPKGLPVGLKEEVAPGCQTPRFEQDHQPPLWKTPAQGSQRLTDLGWMMGKVINDHHVSAPAQLFQATPGPPALPQRLHHLVGRQPVVSRHGPDAQGIADVVLTPQGQLDFHHPQVRVPDLEARKKKLIENIDNLDDQSNTSIIEFKNKTKQIIEDLLNWKSI